MSLLPKTISALRVPADGSAMHIVHVNIVTRPADDGHADCFDDVADFHPWLGTSFKQRRVSDFSIERLMPGFSPVQNAALYGQYSLYYTTETSLPVNQSCARFVGHRPAVDRPFWRGDLFLVRYEGELGMGHEYTDTVLEVGSIVEEIIRGAYGRRYLEKVMEDDKRFQAAELKLI